MCVMCARVYLDERVLSLFFLWNFERKDYFFLRALRNTRFTSRVSLCINSVSTLSILSIAILIVVVIVLVVAVVVVAVVVQREEK